MSDERHLDWDGCVNVRDLGGLPTSDGRTTRWGAAVRADALDRLTAEGWSQLWQHGVRTVVDLRNDDEIRPDLAPRPAELETVHLPLDGIDHREFWDYWSSGPQFGTPLYYGPFLRRFPKRTGAVVGAIARARPGGVVFHCGIGRDRTGLITLVLLSLVGVSIDDMVADYALSAGRLRPLIGEQGSEVERYMAEQGTSLREAIDSTLDGIDLAAYLRAGGVTDDELAALRARLLD